MAASSRTCSMTSSATHGAPSIVKACALCYWDHVCGPKIRHIWTAGRHDELGEELESVCSHALGAELARDARSQSLDCKLYLFPITRTGVFCYVFGAAPEPNADRFVHVLLILFDDCHLGARSPLPPPPLSPRHAAASLDAVAANRDAGLEVIDLIGDLPANQLLRERPLAELADAESGEFGFWKQVFDSYFVRGIMQFRALVEKTGFLYAKSFLKMAFVSTVRAVSVLHQFNISLFDDEPPIVQLQKLSAEFLATVVASHLITMQRSILFSNHPLVNPLIWLLSLFAADAAGSLAIRDYAGLTYCAAAKIQPLSDGDIPLPELLFAAEASSVVDVGVGEVRQMSSLYEKHREQRRHLALAELEQLVAVVGDKRVADSARMHLLRSLSRSSLFASSPANPLALLKDRKVSLPNPASYPAWKIMDEFRYKGRLVRQLVAQMLFCLSRDNVSTTTRLKMLRVVINNFKICLLSKARALLSIVEKELGRPGGRVSVGRLMKCLDIQFEHDMKILVSTCEQRRPGVAQVIFANS